MKPSSGHVGRLLESRGSIIEIAFSAVALALAVNLISTAIADYLGSTRLGFTLAIGIGLLVVVAVYLAARLLARRKARIALVGVYMVDPKKNDVLELPLYEYSEDLQSYLKSAFAENRALRAAWDEEKSRSSTSDFVERSQRNSKSLKLLHEATEYFLLHEFSLHLSSYFTEARHSDRVVVLSRGDIPSVLLTNRLLELFSKPMEDRPAFCDRNRDLPPGSRVVAQYSSEGMFSEFELTLPKKSKVRRTDEGHIEIETPRLVIQLACDVTPWGHNLPRGVERYVLGDEREVRVFPRKVGITIDVTFKFGSLVTATGWEDYKWLDSFESSIREKFSIDDFFERHGWSFAQTMLLMVRPKSLIGSP